jgi:CHRD domain
MRNLSVPLAGALAMILAVPAIAQKAEGGAKIATTLSGAAEVSAGDPDGAGSFTGRVNPGQKQVCYDLTATNIATATMAHIHKAAAGANGPVVVPLTAPASGSSKGCATITRELAMDLIKSPELYYVNVHNAAFPNGAIRGQLSK